MTFDRQMIIEKPKLFDEIWNTKTHEVRLYYPHYRNIATLNPITGLGGRIWYLPMPNLLFMRTIIPGEGRYPPVWVLAVAVAQSDSPSLDEVICLFPAHASYTMVCTDEVYHGTFPIDTAFDEMIRIFWSAYFYSSYYPYHDWEKLTLQQACRRIPQEHRKRFRCYDNYSINDWIKKNTYR